MLHDAARGASNTAQNVANKVIDAANSGSKAVHSMTDSAEVNVGSGKRILSAASGALLFGWGLYGRGLIGYGAMALAASLWDRGVRGHCAV